MTLSLENRFVESLPGDANLSNHPRQVHGALYSEVLPTPVPAPTLLAASREVADLLDLDVDALAQPPLLDVFAGNAVPDGARPYAACYGGHQFGSWAGQLGDGRAIVLGERVTASGRWELQLKGAGPTPYSRTADGRAVLRSSIREFLCSEAMHHLGVPTTRALTLVGTGEPVLRDMFYDGRAAHEPGAIVCRVAPTFLRFGSYELHASRRRVDLLEALVDHTLAEHFPHLGPRSPSTVVAWLSEVAERTAEMVAHWQRVGFVHGVMNTDNLSILGLTIDYGPYGWLEGYDPSWTPNTTDASGRRYRYGNQPGIAGWNLARLAEAMAPLVGEIAPLQGVLDHYADVATRALRDTARQKLGLRSTEAGDEALLDALPQALTVVETDWTIFHRRLAEVSDSADDTSLIGPLTDSFYETVSPQQASAVAAWVRRWHARSQRDHTDSHARREAMNAVNPRYVLRNWLVQRAIDRATEGDPSEIHRLLEALRHPYADQPAYADLDAKRPEWARHRAGCSMLSCSS